MGRLLVESMRRYWLPKESLLTGGHEIVIEGEPFHHIIDVCRQEIGSKFEVLIGDQKALLVEITSITKKVAAAKVLETRIIADLPKPYLHLAISLPRFPVMEAVIEKAVELGVHTIQPFYSDYSFIRKAQSLPEGKVERWKKIISSSTAQTGRGTLMHLAPFVSLNELLTEFNRKPNQLGLFSYEGSADEQIDRYLQNIRKAQPETPEKLWVFVGSEGGFSRTEVQEFQQFKLKSVSLGEQVLRVETACITLLSILKYEFKLF
jgi:16S rRNA (uracil1498-N3)-methyltransferase